MVVDRGPMGGTAPPSWSPDATRLTFVAADNTSIVSMDVATGKSTTLVTQHASPMCAVSATPDGRHVVFVLCRPTSNPDLIAPPEQFYLYTPPS
jgi:Tol biopolymer transport system component